MSKRLALIPALILAASLGFSLAACGAEESAQSAGDVPSAPAETGKAKTKTAAATTTAKDTSEETQTARTSDVVTYDVWFITDDGLTGTRREHPATRAVGRAALEDLLRGPTDDERGRGLWSAIPPGTQLLGLRIAGGVATVDLSSEFETGGESYSLVARLGQVACTLTQFPTVKGVQFELDGEPVYVFSGEGFVLDHPVTCQDYDEVLPAITVATPNSGESVSSPVRVSGSANVFEANVTIKILDRRGNVIAETFTTATCGTGCRGDFAKRVSFEVDRRQPGTILVHDDDAAGVGRPPHQVRIPVMLLP